jgi:hypothetical protein
LEVAYPCGCKIVTDAYGWAVGRLNCVWHDRESRWYIQ